MTKIDYEKIFQAEVKDEIDFIQALKCIISMMYESDAEHIMELIETMEKLLTIKQDHLEDLKDN